MFSAYVMLVSLLTQNQSVYQSTGYDYSFQGLLFSAYSKWLSGYGWLLFRRTLAITEDLAAQPGVPMV